MRILDGLEVSKKIKNEVALEVSKLNKDGYKVGLHVILVGENPASQVYVRNKSKDCEQVGIESKIHYLSHTTTQEDILKLISDLNGDKNVSGILVQLPLPTHIDEEIIINSIDPNKDVDAFSPYNVGKIMIGNYNFLPCTPAGVMEILDHYDIDVMGKHCVIIGRSNIVGKPMTMLMLNKSATVTVCHSKTENLSNITNQADILIAAVGIPKFVKKDMVKEDAVVIDVGINRDDNGKLCGDVDFGEVSESVSYITPVPGGVGPMTRAILLKNAVRAAKIQNKIAD